MQQDTMLCIICNTYNQSAYIENAMNGFSMQETNFPYVCAIFDDASTDGEQEVLKSYLQENFDLKDKTTFKNEETNDYKLTFARHKLNPNCFFVVFFLKYNHYSIKKGRELYASEWTNCVKYIAYCEGDDYWTDPLKLQKQVEFLESHPDYSMCFHNAISHWDKGERNDSLFSQIEDREYSGVEIFERWTVPTASVVLRRPIFEIYKITRTNDRFCYGDIVLFLVCAANGKVYGMSDVMSVYRRHEGGAVYGYDVNRQIRQSYHSLEIYRVFGKEYKSLSVEKFFDNGMEAFLNAKAEGKIHYKLLFHLIRYAPLRTFSTFWKMLKDKVLR